MMISKNKLANQVFLKGTTDDVESVLKAGDVFAFPSAYEGFGMSLAEGMSMGLTAIGYKICSGVNELITDGVDDFSNKLRKLMADRALYSSDYQRAQGYFNGRRYQVCESFF